MRGGVGQSVISRGFRLLEAFGDGASELTLDELASRSGLSRSTTHRLAGQLAEVGALQRSRRGMRLGTRVFELGQLVAREQHLRERAHAHMQDLFVATRQTVQLAVLDAGSVLYVEIIAGHDPAPTPSRRGGRMPLYCTALGKTLLAFSADGGRGYLMGSPQLAARTARTITDPEILRRQLHEIRARQLAWDHEEAATGLRCVAAPIPDTGSTIASAALSVSMATDAPISPAEVAPALRTVARAIAREGTRQLKS